LTESDEKMSKERIEYLDILKGIGIFFVVYEHVSMLPDKSVLGNILMCMSYGAVPCFIMVTGGLMHQSKEPNWQKFALRLIKMYLILCLWKGIFLIFYKNLYSLSFSRKEIFGYLFLFVTLPNVNSRLLWYLEAYLAVTILYPVTWFLFQNGKLGRRILLFWGMLVYLGSLAGIVVSSHYAGITIQAVVPSMTYGNMFFYFIAGAFLLEKRERIRGIFTEKKWFKYIPFSMVFAGTLGLMLVKFLKTGTFCWEHLHVSNSYYRISTIILSVGIYLAVMLLDLHKKKSGAFWGKFLGKTTMGIYLLHGLLVPCVQLYVSAHCPEKKSFLLHLLVTFSMLTICAAVTKLFQKIRP